MIRFSSLGDVVLAGAVTGALAPVSFLTRAAWREVAAALPGVAEVLVWEERPKIRGFDRIIDLHASLRSRTLTALRSGRVARVARYDLRRRLRVAFKQGDPPPTVVERYAAAAGVHPAEPPWLAEGDGRPRDALLLCPGASQATKRWPSERFAEIGRRWIGPLFVLGGPEDRALTGEIAEAIGPRAEAVAERGFTRTLALLPRAQLALAGDTGLMHLGGAAGVPVLALFGPTTSADGFWCWEGPGRGKALEAPLGCRPCSLHGGSTCPIGDHLCMEQLDLETVWEALQNLVDEATGGAPTWPL